MVFVSPFFMVLVSPPTEYCYFHGFTASRGPEIRALKCRPAIGESKKTRCFEKAPKNKEKSGKIKNIKKAEKRKKREKEKKKKKRKTKKKKERKANYILKLPIIRACRGRYVK